MLMYATAEDDEEDDEDNHNYHDLIMLGVLGSAFVLFTLPALGLRVSFCNTVAGGAPDLGVG
jgi:hypothetical protein